MQVPDLHFDKWDNELDHTWHEFESTEFTEEQPTVTTDIADWLKFLLTPCHCRHPQIKTYMIRNIQANDMLHSLPGSNLFPKPYLSFMKRFFLPAIILFTLASCSSKKRIAGTTAPVTDNSVYAVTNKVYTHQTDSLLKIIGSEAPPMLIDSTGNTVPAEWVGTVNFGMRKPNYVIIHYTAQDSVQQTLRTFTLTRTAVSAHYVVAKDGRVFHMVNDYLRANQAGIGKWGSITDMNSCSIGIEIDNNGSEPYTGPQIKSLVALLVGLKKAYNIPTANFIGHQDWAPKRKPDPGPFFPWQTAALYGIGYWSDYIVVPAPANYDYITALRLIGYDTSNLNAAVVAFKRHFVQSDITPAVTPLMLNVLYNVAGKY